MAGHKGRRRRHASHDDDHPTHPDERWLVSYADMVTLLMCLFMVLFSISSVNISKFESLQRALKEAFSGKILPGGHSVMAAGSNPVSTRPSPEAPFQEAEGPGASRGRSGSKGSEAALKEQQDLRALKARVDGKAQALGLSRHVQTVIDDRGLVIRLTDRVLFDSGRAELRAAAAPLVDGIGRIVAQERRHPARVEGHTDSVPISGGPYPSNWELSTARATTVARRLAGDGVAPQRLSATGYASYRPIGPNGTAAGRQRNRRVEIVLARLHQQASHGGDALPTQGGTPK